MNYMIGVEREGLRINSKGELADTPHPLEFGDRLKNPTISTDFGDAMLELRTHPQTSADACYAELLKTTIYVLKLLYKRQEFIWPYSIPYKIPDEAHFRYNPYPYRPDYEEYERLLTKIYGLKKNCISGIHINFSFSNEMFDKMRKIYSSVPDDKDETYFKCARLILKNKTAVQHFFDASPSDFDGNIIEENSFRNSKNGIRSENAKKLDYSSKDAYLKSVKNTEKYDRLAALIRLKSTVKENLDAGIEERGIARLEFRLCDINPFDICGISIYEIELSAAIIFTSMVKDELPDNPSDILLECSEVNKTLKLGFERGIKHFMEREKTGKSISDEVRTLLEKDGYKGLINLAVQYGKNCSE